MTLQKELKLYLPNPLSEKQKAEIGERMADIEILISEIEQRKKAVTNDLGERIKSLESELYGLAKSFKNNTAETEVECRVDFNTPERGKKTIIRLDLNEIARIEDMSEYELKAIEQPELFDKQENDNDGIFSPKIFINYGIEVDRFFTVKEFEENIFIVKTEDDLLQHNIEVENIDKELLNDIMGSLALRLDEKNEKHVELIGSDKYFFFAETEESENLSWFFFQNLNPDAKAEEPTALECTVVIFDPDTMDVENINESYSGDTLVKDKIRRHFEIDGKKYVNVGGTDERITAYELIPEDQYQGQTHTYKEAVSKDIRTNEGHLITYRKKQYVLSNPIDIVFEESTGSESESEYAIPESTDAVN